MHGRTNTNTTTATIIIIVVVRYMWRTENQKKSECPGRFQAEQKQRGTLGTNRKSDSAPGNDVTPEKPRGISQSSEKPMNPIRNLPLPPPRCFIRLSRNFNHVTDNKTTPTESKRSSNSHIYEFCSSDYPDKQQQMSTEITPLLYKTYY